VFSEGTVYFRVIAATGQASTAAWQSHLSHASGSLTCDLPSSPSSKTSGQTATQAPQPIHASESTTGFGMGKDIFLYNKNVFERKHPSLALKFDAIER